MSVEDLFEELIELSMEHELASGLAWELGREVESVRENSISNMYVDMAALIRRFEHLDG